MLGILPSLQPRPALTPAFSRSSRAGSRPAGGLVLSRRYRVLICTVPPKGFPKGVVGLPKRPPAGGLVVNSITRFLRIIDSHPLRLGTMACPATLELLPLLPRSRRKCSGVAQERIVIVRARIINHSVVPATCPDCTRGGPSSIRRQIKGRLLVNISGSVVCSKGRCVPGVVVCSIAAAAGVIIITRQRLD